ncbi:hypothetical protein GLW08_04575 [Pontibacillus yanchengensis]|uniref:Uncharacterized protein n=2 Tax=Pontibacillus yanchengensis TaxID=462910 RepID=A0A6I5A1T8_9BACI|nr:hypothetical protein [Pontibacillus yanchengensis]MYL32031.1 hypothetical protein [Pontibacillus yanchengensis]MYL52609.1 hypothetical protein [Pontibacillus yanchengensis]
MVQEVKRRDGYSCLVCGHIFDFEAPLQKDYQVSKDAVRARAVAVNTMEGSDEKLVNLMLYTDCPQCGVTNECKEVL